MKKAFIHQESGGFQCKINMHSVKREFDKATVGQQLPTLACGGPKKKRRIFEAHKGPLRFSLKCLKEPPVGFFTRR